MGVLEECMENERFYLEEVVPALIRCLELRFTNVAIESEQQARQAPMAAPTKPADHTCAYANDPQPNNKWQTKCLICGYTSPF